MSYKTGSLEGKQSSWEEIWKSEKKELTPKLMQNILKHMEIYFFWRKKRCFLKLIFWISVVYISSIPDAVKPTKAIPFKCLMK